MQKPNWLKDSIAKEDGFYTLKGEKLKGQRLDQEQIRKWNKSAPAMEVQQITIDINVEDVVQEVTMEVEVEVEVEVSSDTIVEVESMTKPQLIEYASINNIEIDPKAKKADILQIILDK